MLKKAVQQGRSEPLSEARTKLADFFSILLGLGGMNGVSWRQSLVVKGG
jgi:hypothetical protein